MIVKGGLLGQEKQPEEEGGKERVMGLNKY
jgi:hypothetical protein